MTVRRTALLGFGHVAERGHLPAWQRRDDFRITAVADRDPQRRALARQLVPGARIYDDSIRAIESEELDVVDVATPPTLHAPLVVHAARAGCHVLCEKPLVTSAEDYRDVLTAVRGAGVTLYTVHNWKHSAQFAWVAALLDEGRIGRLGHLRLETVRTGRAPTVGTEWRGDAALAGGGILIDHGWHALYLLLGLARERAEHVSATIERRRYTTAEVEDTATLRIQFPTLTGEIYLTWAGETRRTQWQLRGAEGHLSLDGDRGELRHAAGTDVFTFPRSLADGSHHPDWFGAVIDGFVREIEHPASRGINLAEAESCLLLTRLAYASGERGGTPLPVPASFPMTDAGAPLHA